jgi:uncharacterized protein YbaR (Trm112 family)/SAM-dependent methyltransferase
MPFDPSRAVVEEHTRTWLEDQAQAGVGVEPPVYGPDGEPRRVTKDHFENLLRKLKIFRWLERVSFDSFLEVASGWDMLPWLVRERYGAETFFSDMMHAVNLPHDVVRLGKLDHAVTLNVVRLPFRDEAFDVVVCSEVLEHLVRPVEAIAELLRVTRTCLVMTSLEALSPDRLRRGLQHFRADVRLPHVERTFLLRSEFGALLGRDLHTENLLSPRDAPANQFAPRAEIDAAHERLRDTGSLVAALCRAAAYRGHDRGAMGIVLAKMKPGARLRPEQPGIEEELARWLVREAAAFERYRDEVIAVGALFRARPETRPPETVFRDRPVAPALLDLLRCPDCRGALVADGPGTRCAACGQRFPGEFGVPMLYPTVVPEGRAAEDECVQRLCPDEPARARVVRALMRRLRRNERPPGRLRRAAWALDRALGRPLG